MTGVYVDSMICEIHQVGHQTSQPKAGKTHLSRYRSLRIYGKHQSALVLCSCQMNANDATGLSDIRDMNL